MGLTAGCAEGHSHKYDPISHTEYYGLFDLFNQTADTDRGDEQPRLATPTPAQAEAKARLDAELARLDRELAGSYLAELRLLVLVNGFGLGDEDLPAQNASARDRVPWAACEAHPARKL